MVIMDENNKFRSNNFSDLYGIAFKNIIGRAFELSKNGDYETAEKVIKEEIYSLYFWITNKLQNHINLYCLFLRKIKDKK
jgi:hypothetical protein